MSPQGIARLWQLTNTRYILGMSGFLDALNKQIDPQGRFRILTSFDFVPKPSAPATGPTKVEEITAVLKPDGQFSVFEFTGALARASLFTNWQVPANDQDALARLTNSAFDPTKTVLVAAETPSGMSLPTTNQPPGSVEILS